jgi:hypothetical protein
MAGAQPLRAAFLVRLSSLEWLTQHIKQEAGCLEADAAPCFDGLVAFKVAANKLGRLTGGVRRPNIRSALLGGRGSRSRASREETLRI